MDFSYSRVPSSQLNLWTTCTSCPASWRHPCFHLLLTARWSLAGLSASHCNSSLTAAWKGSDSTTWTRSTLPTVITGNAPPFLNQVYWIYTMITSSFNLSHFCYRLSSCTIKQQTVIAILLFIVHSDPLFKDSVKHKHNEHCHAEDAVSYSLRSCTNAKKNPHRLSVTRYRHMHVHWHYNTYGIFGVIFACSFSFSFFF